MTAATLTTRCEAVEAPSRDSAAGAGRGSPVSPDLVRAALYGDGDLMAGPTCHPDCPEAQRWAGTDLPTVSELERRYGR